MPETCRVIYDNKLNCCIKLVPLVSRMLLVLELHSRAHRNWPSMFLQVTRSNTHTHTHTHTYIYIYEKNAYKYKQKSPLSVVFCPPTVLTDIKPFDWVPDGCHVEVVDVIIHFQVSNASFESIFCRQLVIEASRVSGTPDKEGLPKSYARKQALRKKKKVPLHDPFIIEDTFV
jgi:hypothetical protein